MIDAGYDHDQLTAELLTIPYCPWTPNEGPQTRFLLDMCKEALYGGSPGSSKSAGLMMAASQFLAIPGYAALLLRKTYTDLNRPGALMSLAQDWWGGKPGVRFDREQHTYHFSCPGGGESTIGFGALDTINDKYKYQGGAWTFIGLDETTQFPEDDYRFLFSRLRKPSSGPISQIPLRHRGASNPGGVHWAWVYKRFVAPWEAWGRGEAPYPERHYHPATLADNPHLDVPSYLESLRELDPVTRQQYLTGSWSIRPEGRMFKRSWFKMIDRSQVPGDCRWVRAWDFAATEPVPGLDPDYTVGLLMGRAPDGRFFISDMRRWREGPAMNDLRIKATVLHDTRRVDQVMEQEPGSSGKSMVRHYRIGPFVTSGVRAVPASGKGRGRITSISAGRHTPIGKIRAAIPLASHANAGEVFIVVDGSWDHEALLDELDIYPDGLHDDIADCASLALDDLVKNPIIAPYFGGSVEDLTMENYWAPQPYAESENQLETGWQGQRVPEERARTRSEVERESGNLQSDMNQIYGV